MKHAIRTLSIFGSCCIAVLAASWPAAADPCSTSTSCSFGSCSFSKPCDGVVSCQSWCNSGGVYCNCQGFQVEIEPEFDAEPRAGTLDRRLAGGHFDLGGDMNLASLAVMVNDLAWGVEMDAGDEGTLVETGSYSGTLTEILEDLGDDNGFSVWWDDARHVVTLTAD